MSKIQLIIEQLEETKSNIMMWNIYSDGYKEGIQYAIDLMKIAEGSPIEEMEVANA